MSFLYPSFLWALLLIAIPVVIHLFNFRVYKTIYFSNIRFLQDIKDVSDSKSKIKHLIILLLRILTIIALTIAFAGPYVPLIKTKGTLKESIVSIYLDNSYSMNAGSLHGNLFDAAKERARKIVSSYDSQQKFIFLTNDMESKHRVITNKQQVTDFINNTELTGAVPDFSELINFQQNFIYQKNEIKQFNHLFYMISDFQKVVFDIKNFVSDTSTIYSLLPLATNSINNIYIDSCWFSTPGRNLNKIENLNVRLVNKGVEEYQDIPIRIFVNGKQKAINNISIEANSEKTIILKYSNTESGILPSYLEITDYPITYDNIFYFSYQINKQTSILIVNNKSENKYLNTLFKSDSSFICKNSNTGSLKTSEFSDYQVIILDELEGYSSGLVEELKRFVSHGGVLVCIPGEKTNLNELNFLLSAVNANRLNTIDKQITKIEKINYDHFIYKDVFIKIEDKLILPEIKSYFTVNINNQIVSLVLLSSASGKPLLVQTNFEKGKVYCFAFPLTIENGDFVAHPLFVPTLYNIAAFSQTDERLFYTIGKDNIIDLNLKPSTGDRSMHLFDIAGKTDFIPQLSGIGEQGVRLNLMKNIVIADNYLLKENNNNLKCLSFNYNRKESDPDYYKNDEIEKLIEEYKLLNYNLLPAELNELETQIEDSLKERKDYWKWFISLAFIFLISEILILRFWKD